jgi:hypothetical protein
VTGPGWRTGPARTPPGFRPRQDRPSCAVAVPSRLVTGQMIRIEGGPGVDRAPGRRGARRLRPSTGREHAFSPEPPPGRRAVPAVRRTAPRGRRTPTRCQRVVPGHGVQVGEWDDAPRGGEICDRTVRHELQQDATTATCRFAVDRGGSGGPGCRPRCPDAGSGPRCSASRRRARRGQWRRRARAPRPEQSTRRPERGSRGRRPRRRRYLADARSPRPRLPP